MSGPLQQRLDQARQRVEAAKAGTSFAELEALVAQAEPPRNFFSAVTRHVASTRPTDPGYTSIIGEIAAASPQSPDPAIADRARQYHLAGVSALSIVTEPPTGLPLGAIDSVRAAVPIPIMRRDFIIDPWQLWESRAAGADAVMLYADALTEGQIVDLQILSQQLGLTSVLEVSSMDGLLRARPYVGFPHAAYAILSINNRSQDSTQNEGDLTGTLRLLDLVDDRSILISEGGVRYRADILKLAGEGVRAVLLGEELAFANDPAALVAELLGKVVR